MTRLPGVARARADTRNGRSRACRIPLPVPYVAAHSGRRMSRPKRRASAPTVACSFESPALKSWLAKSRERPSAPLARRPPPRWPAVRRPAAKGLARCPRRPTPSRREVGPGRFAPRRSPSPTATSVSRTSDGGEFLRGPGSPWPSLGWWRWWPSGSMPSPGPWPRRKWRSKTSKWRPKRGKGRLRSPGPAKSPSPTLHRPAARIAPLARSPAMGHSQRRSSGRTRRPRRLPAGLSRFPLPSRRSPSRWRRC